MPSKAPADSEICHSVGLGGLEEFFSLKKISHEFMLCLEANAQEHLGVGLPIPGKGAVREAATHRHTPVHSPLAHLFLQHEEGLANKAIWGENKIKAKASKCACCRKGILTWRVCLILLL